MRSGVSNQTTDSTGLVKYGTLLFAASMVTNLSNYAFRIFMSHKLSDVDYSALDALLSIFMIISVPAMSIQMATAEYASSLGGEGRHAEIADLFVRSLRRVGAACVGGFLVFLLVSGFVADYLHIVRKTPVVLLGVALFSALMLPAANGILQGLQRFGPLGLIGIAGGAARLSAGIIFIFLGLGINGAVGASVVSSIATLLVAYFLLKSILVKPGERRADSSGVYRYFVPIVLFLSCQSLLSFVDSIVAKHYLDPAQAGVYFRAAIVGKAFLYLPTAMAMVLFPKAATLYSLKESSFKLLGQAMGCSVAIALSGALVCYFFADPLAYAVGGTSESGVLIRYFGLCVTPIALLQLLISHDLAVRRVQTLYPLGVGTVVFIFVLFNLNETPGQILAAMSVAGSGLCALCLGWSWFVERRATHA